MLESNSDSANRIVPNRPEWYLAKPYLVGHGPTKYVWIKHGCTDYPDSPTADAGIQNQSADEATRLSPGKQLKDSQITFAFVCGLNTTDQLK